WVGLFLVLLAFAAWIWGEFVQRSTSRRGLAIAVCLLLLGFGYGYCLENELGWRSPPTAATSAGNHKRDRDGIDWQPWSAAAVEKAQGEGRPVLVDFTANWCLTCQLTKSTALEVSSVRAKIKQTNTAALVADFTREDPVIADELKRFNHAAVPLVLVFPKDRSRQPVILPTWPLLTPSIVVSALDDAAK
ncbi:MAG TPA: thioredoxin family protein, partial [Verrucomicrobiae bacterium]|nr:thioredoxin family protein [Verrucomicrobiae bacterium]